VRTAADVRLAAARAQLPAASGAAYMNAGTFGPLPRATVEAMLAREGRNLREGRVGPRFFPEFEAAVGAARERIAKLLGAAPGAVALTRSTTDGCHVVVQGLRLERGDEIVTTDVEHFGLLATLGASSARVRVAELRGRPAADALEAIAAHVGPRTRLIAVSHVAWSTGQVLPVRELAALGVPILVDGAQSAGAIPVDVGELGCDFYALPGQKWLLGPEGTGALYVRPDQLDALAVALPSYQSQAGYGTDGTFTPLPGSARFDPAWIPYGALEGLAASVQLLEVLGDAGPAHALALAGRCREALLDRVELVTEAGQATLVTFAPSGTADETVRRLAEAGVLVRAIPREGWVRASIGFWCTDDDIDRLVEAL